MSENNCPYCGTPLLETTFGRKFCPNHGIIEEEKEEQYNNYNPDNYRGYIK